MRLKPYNLYWNRKSDMVMVLPNTFNPNESYPFEARSLGTARAYTVNEEGFLCHGEVNELDIVELVGQSNP